MYTPFDHQQIRLVTKAEDADFLEPRVPERLQGDIPKLLAEALKGKPKVIETLKKMIRDFQKYPVYKNLLYTAYVHGENYRAAEQVAEQMYRMHPEYTYARANYADSLLRRRDDPERVLEVLHPSLHITEAFPGRHSFHVGEFIAYERSVIMYLAQTGATREAEDRLQMLGNLDAAERALLHTLRLFIDTHQPFNPLLPALQTPQLEALYFAGSFMTAEVMRDIMHQPREALVADLCHLLDDLTDRADYWNDENLPGYVGYTPLHAMMLLAELKAEETLPVILRFLSQPAEAVDRWFGDFITELLPEVMARFATPDHYERLAAFSTDQNRDAFICNIGILAVVYRAARQPELREPATQWLESVILHLLPTAVAGDNNLHLDLAVSAIIELRAETLLPLVERAFEQDLLDEAISGDYREFTGHLADQEKWWPAEHYTDLEKGCAFIYSFGYEAFTAPPPSQKDNPWLRQIAMAAAERSEKKADDWENAMLPPKARDQISLNAPCPCGSGKKYKRCHGLKQ